MTKMEKSEVQAAAEKVLKVAGFYLRAAVANLQPEHFKESCDAFEAMSAEDAADRFETRLSATSAGIPMLTLVAIELPQHSETGDFAAEWALPFSDWRMVLTVSPDGTSRVDFLDEDWRVAYTTEVPKRLHPGTPENRPLSLKNDGSGFFCSATNALDALFSLVVASSSRPPERPLP